MAYTLVQNGKTQFAIDWDIISRLTRSYYTAYLQWSYGEETTISDSRWYNPLSWSLPDISHIEVDWDRVRRDAVSKAERDVGLMRRVANVDAASVAKFLEARVGEAARYKEQFVDWMGDVQTRNMHNVESAVKSYEADKEIAKFVRDRSYDMLMICAGVMTGGEALVAMGAGSFLKGQAKFQDTGSLGAATMEGAGTFVFAYVKLGKEFSLKQDVVLAFVQAPYKIATEVVGGATFGDAALAGALTLATPGTDRLFNFAPGKTFFDRAAIPLTIKYGGKDLATEVLKGSKKLAAGTVAGMMKSSASSFVQGGLEATANKLAGPRKGEAAGERAPQSSSLLDEATLTNRHLLDLAFVNMDKGIGRGW